MNYRKQCVLAAIVAFALCGAGVAEARSKYRKRALRSADVLDQIMNARDRGLPEWIMDDAVGVIVIPSVKKGGFGIGGRYGRGIGTFRHTGGTWGPPVFFGLHGGSFGLQPQDDIGFGPHHPLSMSSRGARRRGIPMTRPLK